MSLGIITIIVIFVIFHAITIIHQILHQGRQLFLFIHAWDFASFYVLYNVSEEKEEHILLINSNPLLFIILKHLLQIKKQKSKKFLLLLQIQHQINLLNPQITLKVLHFLPTKDINTNLLKIKVLGSQIRTILLLLSQDTIHHSSTKSLKDNHNILNK